MKKKQTTDRSELKKYKYELHFDGKKKSFFEEKGARIYASKNNIQTFTIIPINVIKQYNLFTLVKREGTKELTPDEIISLFKESIFYKLFKGNPEFSERNYWSTYLKDFIVNSHGLGAKYNLSEFKYLADHIYRNQLL